MRYGFSESVRRFQRRLPSLELMRSGWVTAGVLLAGVLIFGVAWQAHRRARFHQLTTKAELPTPAIPMPGGREAVMLSRLAMFNNTAPEFIAATLLPGLGMNVLQVEVDVPDQGRLKLLAGPTLGELPNPVPETLLAAPFTLRVEPHAIGAGHVQTAADWMNTTSAQEAEERTTADGGEATAEFTPNNPADNFGVHAVVSAMLTGHALDLTVRLQNTAAESRAISIGWSPRFAAPAGDLQKLSLSLPSAATAGAPDFSDPLGMPLPRQRVEAVYGNLRTDFLAEGSVTMLSDHGGKFTLRLTSIGPLIRSIRLKTNPDDGTLRLSFESGQGRENEPFVLRAGQTTSWHMRMEILPLQSSAGDLRSAVPAADLHNAAPSPAESGSRE